jgi:hypothetical protein
MIDQEIEGKFKQLEQQHYDYMNHVNMQINTLQQQIQALHQSRCKLLFYSKLNFFKK